MDNLRVRAQIRTRAGYEVTNAAILRVQSTGGGGTTPGVTVPATPANLAATGTSSSSISLAWQDKSNNESGFRIERKTGAGGSWAAIVTNKAANSTTHTDTGLSAATTYVYRVAAFNSAGGAANFSNEASATTSQGPPQVRDLLVAFENGGQPNNYSYTPNPVSPVANHVLRYADGTTVTLTAPGVAANGNVFSQWFRGGQIFSATQAILLTVSQNETVTAVYVAPPVVDSRTLNLTVSPSSAGTVTGGGSFGQGALVTIKAMPNAGHNFWNWTTSGGQLFSAYAELSFQLTTNLNLVANFVPSGGSYSVTATADPPTGGTISGAGNYSNGQTVTLTATPTDGWTFGTWSENGAIVSFNSTVSFLATQSRNLVALFNPDFSKNYTLSITAVNGTAIRSPNQTAYTPNSTVTVTATPHPGYYFTGWSQDAGGTANPLPVLMTKNKMVTANFSSVPAATYTLSGQSVVHDGSTGNVVRSPNQAFYAEESTVLLTANAGSGSVFVGWKGDAYGTANPFSMTMDSHKIAYAQFVKPSSSSAVVELKSPLFTFNLPGTQSSATGVLRNPTTSGAVLYFAATARVPWIKMGSSMGSIPGFTGQSEGVIGFICEENPLSMPRAGEIWIYAPGATNSPQIFTVNQAAAVPHYTLQTQAENGAISRSPDQPRYPTGTSVTITATPISGYAFSSWSGDASGSQNPLSVTMNSNKAITAEFIRLPKPDVIAQLSPSLSSGPAGSKLVFNGTVRNLGVDPASAGRVYFRITESSVTPPEITFGQSPFVDFGSLIPNGSENISSVFEIPQDIPIGSYHLWVLVDPENVSGEQTSSRANNQGVHDFQVVPDTIPPNVQVSVPAAANFLTNSPTLNLSGTASDNISVERVAWQNDRGGSGEAGGTNQWDINDVLLDLGINVITVTAFDSEGNSTSRMLTVRYYPPDDIPPTIEVVFPTTEATFEVLDASINLGGTAWDNFEILQIRWANSRGGSGIADGLESWVASSIQLKPGINVITITAEDIAANTASTTLMVTHSPAKIPGRPVAAFTSPKNGLRSEDASVQVSGTASAKDGLNAVLWQVNDAPWQPVTGAVQWTFLCPLEPGPNVIRVRALDMNGVESLPASRVVTRVVRGDLALAVEGEGTVAYGGFKSLQGLEFGKNYTLAATPRKGWIFAGWSGGLGASMPKISFTMREGLETTATFVENPFAEVAGAYLGLARSEPETHEGNGLLRATVASGGAFSASLGLGRQNHRLRGQFDSNGWWTGEIKRGKQPPLSALLILGTTSGSDTLTGMIADGTSASQILADRLVYHTRDFPAPQAGRLTFAIDCSDEQTWAPKGYGAGTLVVDAGGKTKLLGRLPDGTGVTFSGHVAKTGAWPLHVPLYQKGGSITGRMIFADVPESDSAGMMHWFKPQRPKDPRYSLGFDLRPAFFAQRYAPPPARNLRILSLWDSTDGNGSLRLFGPEMGAGLAQSLNWQVDNRLSSDGSVVRITRWQAVPKTGLFSGSFLNPFTLKSLPMSGALLQKTGEGFGWFQGVNQNGGVVLERDEQP